MAHHFDMLIDQKIVGRRSHQDRVNNILVNLIIAVVWTCTMLILGGIMYFDAQS